jgi:hypothetical protein
MATASRGHAYRILLALDRPGPTLADLLADDEVEHLAPRDQAFLRELLLGTLATAVPSTTRSPRCCTGPWISSTRNRGRRCGWGRTRSSACAFPPAPR